MSSSNIGLYVCIMLTLVGLIFSTIAYRSWDASNKIIKKGISTEGVVVELRNRVNKNRQTGTQAPVVQFRTLTGDIVTYYSNTYTSPCPYTVGQYVPIWYAPNNPQEATLNSTDAHLLPMIFGGFGILALLFGLPTVLKFLINLIFS